MTHKSELRHGGAVIEFAVIAPLLILLTLGMLEYGRMLMVQQMLTSASAEGARECIAGNPTTSEVQTIVQNYLSGCGISGSTVVVAPDPPSSAGYGETVTVTVSVAFDQVSWLPNALYLNGKTLSASSAMRRQTFE